MPETVAQLNTNPNPIPAIGTNLPRDFFVRLVPKRAANSATAFVMACLLSSFHALFRNRACVSLDRSPLPPSSPRW